MGAAPAVAGLVPPAPRGTGWGGGWLRSAAEVSGGPFMGPAALAAAPGSGAAAPGTARCRRALQVRSSGLLWLVLAGARAPGGIPRQPWISMAALRGFA